MLSDADTIQDLPAGGWPYAYLYDSPCCSVIGSLGLEDTFKPAWFLADTAIYGALPAIVGAIIVSLRRRRV
jgi:hypothetical protein